MRTHFLLPAFGRKGIKFQYFCPDFKLSVMKGNQIACRLTSIALRERKETIIARLKELILATQKIENGYVFHFPGTDESFNQIMDFVKSERACCPFFQFDILVAADEGSIHLRLSGPRGAQEFIRSELGLVNEHHTS